MSVLCIVIGVVMLAAFAGAGFYLTTQQVIVNLLSMAKIPSYAIIIAFCVVGAIFCLNWVVLGTNCAAIKMLKKRRKKKHIQE